MTVQRFNILTPREPLQYSADIDSVDSAPVEKEQLGHYG